MFAEVVRGHLGLTDIKHVFPGFNGPTAGGLGCRGIVIGTGVGSSDPEPDSIVERPRRSRSLETRPRSRFTLPLVTLQDLRTPCVLVDWARAERNIDRMQAAATAGGLRLRPHAKTHKSPELARLQIARGAVGICCAKLGEAEVFADAGIADIRLPYPLHPRNADRVLALLDRAAHLVHRRSRGRGAGLVRRAAARRIARSTCWSRSTSACIAAASIPTRLAPPTWSRGSPRCPACASAAC